MTITNKENLKLLIQKIILQIKIYQIMLLIQLGAKRTAPVLPTPKYIIIHHQAGNWTFEQVNNYHKKLWGFKSSLEYYAGYQIMLFKNLTMKRARRDNEEGAHCPGHNKDSIGICLEGDYSKEKLNLEFGNYLTNVVDELREKYNIPRENVLGDFEGRIASRPTLCPCSVIDWVNTYRDN